MMPWTAGSRDRPAAAREGTFKAAELRFTTHAQVERAALLTWLGEARMIQWDYKHIMANRGLLRLA